MNIVIKMAPQKTLEYNDDLVTPANSGVARVFVHGYNILSPAKILPKTLYFAASSSYPNRSFWWFHCCTFAGNSHK